MIYCVLGAGSWGTSLAEILADNGHEVKIYARKEEVRDEINNNHSNNKYFPFRVKLNEKLFATSSIKDAVEGSDVIVISVPSSQYRNVLDEVLKYLNKKVIIVSTAKGFDPDSNKRLSEVIREIIPSNKLESVLSLMGPSHAEEVIRKLFTCVSVIGADISNSKKIQRAFSNEYFRVYTNVDEVGAEYASAMKNIMAIASGIMTGLGYGDNTRAALITRGLAEMTRLGIAEGGKIETYLGLTGLGDLMVTCNSSFSRNFQAGLAIGKVNSADQFLKTNKKTVEGIKTSKVIHIKAKQLGVEMPIAEAVYSIIFCEELPSNAVKTLISRALKPEF